jgi:hypothetical protein
MGRDSTKILPSWNLVIKDMRVQTCLQITARCFIVICRKRVTDANRWLRNLTLILIILIITPHNTHITFYCCIFWLTFLGICLNCNEYLQFWVITITFWYNMYVICTSM